MYSLTVSNSKLMNKLYTQMDSHCILSFCNSFGPSCGSLSSLTQLSDGLLLLHLLQSSNTTPIPQTLIKSRQECLSSWQPRLSNLKLLTTSLDQSLKNSTLRSKGKRGIDLLEIAKSQDQEEIKELFERVFEVIVNSENRNYFIQNITELGGEEQEYFSHKIVEYMQEGDGGSYLSPREGDEGLLHKVFDLEEEVRVLKSANATLGNQNHQYSLELQKYKSETLKLTEEIHLLESQLLQFHQKEHQATSHSLTKSESTIKQLQQKLAYQQQEHQKRTLRLDQEITTLQSRVLEADLAEKRGLDSEHRNRQLLEKVHHLEEELEETREKMRGAGETIKSLQSQIRSLNEDCNRKEFQRISLKAENAKSHARSSQLQRMLQMSLDHRKARTPLSLHSQTLNIQDPFETKYEEMNSCLNISNRRIKELERELARANIRGERLERVEAEKKRVEDVLVECMSSRGEQVEVLIGVIYELRMRVEAGESGRGERNRKEDGEESTLSMSLIEYD